MLEEDYTYPCTISSPQVEDVLDGRFIDRTTEERVLLLRLQDDEGEMAGFDAAELVSTLLSASVTAAYLSNCLSSLGTKYWPCPYCQISNSRMARLHLDLFYLSNSLISSAILYVALDHRGVQS